MNSNFIPTPFPSPQVPSEDDDFNVVGDEIFATFSPWASWLSDGNPFAPSAIPALATQAGSAATLGDPGSAVAVTSGGITINLIFDAAALAAPASFRAGIQEAVAILAAAISDKITVNIKIDYSGTGHGAAAGPDHGLYQSYSSIRADLINNATPGDTTFNTLAAGSSIQGQSNVAVWNAQLKLWGLMGANDTTTDDGSATFATDINPNLLVGVALHELTHAMGRVPFGTPNSTSPDIFDLFRFTSPGTRLFLGGATAPAAYFSLDGGNTKVADYGRTSDASDFLNSGVQGPNDPFNEFYTGSTSQQLTAADLKQLDALGFHLVAADTGSVSIDDVTITEGNGGTQLATFTVTRSGGTAAFAVNFATADDSATVADHDYVANAGTLNFGAGVNTQTISVTVNGDTKLEANETFFVNLSGATNGATISDNQGIGTISNDDGNLSARVNDFNGDLSSDLLWRHNGGTFTEWQSTGNGFTANVVVNTTVNNSWHSEGAFDFSGDGRADLLWRNDASGTFTIWNSTGNGFTQNNFIGNGVDTSWSVAGLADFNGDGKSDMLFRHSNGTFTEWQSTGTGFTPNVVVVSSVDTTWHLAATADFSGDGKADLLWRNNNGTFTEWQSTGNGFTPNVVNISSVDTTWHVLGTGDFNGDGKTDLLWRSDNGTFTEWQSTGNGFTPNVFVNSTVDNSWHLAQVADFNSDSKADLLWRNDNGMFTEWQSTGNSFTPNVVVNGTVGTDWTLITHHYDLV